MSLEVFQTPHIPKLNLQYYEQATVETHGIGNTAMANQCRKNGCGYCINSYYPVGFTATEYYKCY